MRPADAYPRMFIFENRCSTFERGPTACSTQSITACFLSREPLQCDEELFLAQLIGTGNPEIQLNPHLSWQSWFTEFVCLSEMIAARKHKVGEDTFRRSFTAYILPLCKLPAHWRDRGSVTGFSKLNSNRTKPAVKMTLDRAQV